jgi:hypothetical protein
MTYTLQTWTDNDPTTPLSAARLTHIEQGIGGLDVNLPIITVQGAGIDNTGVSDSATAIQSLITGAAGKIVYFPPGTYKINTQISIPTGTKIRGAGMSLVTIDGTGITNQTAFFKASGTFTGTTSLLTGNVGPNVLTATLTSASGFAAGDFGRLESTASTGVDGILAGEILSIYSIATNTLTFDSFIQGTYTTAASAKFTKITFLEDVEISDIGFIGTVNDATKQQCAIEYDYVKNGLVRRVKVQHCHMYGVELWNCLGSRVEDCDFYHCSDAALGYAICNDGATADTVAIGNRFRDCKAAVEHTGSTGQGGVPRRCIFAYNTITGAYRGAMQAHTGAEDLIFAFNTVASTTSNELAGAQVDGMNVPGTRLTIVGNKFTGIFRRAIYVHNGTYNPFHTLIANNTAIGLSLGVSFGRGIEVDFGQTSGGTVEACTIIGNQIKMSPAGNTDPAIDIENGLSTLSAGVKVQDNIIYADTTNQGIRAVYLKDFTISGNTITTFGTGAPAIQIDNSQDGVISGNVCVGSGGSNTVGGIQGATTINVACIGNRVRNFQNGVKTTGTSGLWAVAANVLLGFVNSGAELNLSTTAGANTTTGANV